MKVRYNVTINVVRNI